MNTNDHSKSVTHYLKELKKGSDSAANELVTRYWPRVIAAASSQFNSAGIRLADEEDVAISVFDCLCRQAIQGKFGDEKMNDRMELWRYLSTLIKRKVIDVARREKAVKRGSGNVVNEAVLEADENAAGLRNFEGVTMTPIQQAIQIEEKTRLLDSLQSDELREIVVLYLENYRLTEIGMKFGLTERTIRRKLELAKQAWANLAE